jgi:hypothetical protein
MLWKVPVKPVMLGHARLCTQHNGQGEDHSTALMHGVLYQFFHENRRFFFESTESMMGLAVL